MGNRRRDLPGLIYPIPGLWLPRMHFASRRCCCTTPVFDCVDCTDSEAPSSIILTLAGVANDGCGNCGDYNTDHQLDRDPNCTECCWTKLIDDGCFTGSTESWFVKLSQFVFPTVETVLHFFCGAHSAAGGFDALHTSLFRKNYGNTDPVNCKGWSGESLSYVGSTGCDFSGATAEVTAA